MFFLLGYSFVVFYESGISILYKATVICNDKLRRAKASGDLVDSLLQAKR